MWKVDTIQLERHFVDALEEETKRRGAPRAVDRLEDRPVGWRR